MSNPTTTTTPDLWSLPQQSAPSGPVQYVPSVKRGLHAPDEKQRDDLAALERAGKRCIIAGDDKHHYCAKSFMHAGEWYVGLVQWRRRTDRMAPQSMCPLFDSRGQARVLVVEVWSQLTVAPKAPRAGGRA